VNESVTPVVVVALTVRFVTVPGLPEGPYYTEPPDLTSAYVKAVPSSAFDTWFAWRGFLAYHGMRSAEVRSVLALRAGLIRRCIEHPDYIQDNTGRRVVHVLSKRLSVVCVRSPKRARFHVSPHV
jgi:hypothetical protein